MNKNEAQGRIDRIEAFWAEARALEEEGVTALTPEQRSAALAHHGALRARLSREFDVDTSAGEMKLSLAMKIASALGGLAFCLALGLFVQRYWGLLDTWLQVGLLIAAPLIAIALAEFASQRERTLYFTSLLCLVALAAFVVNLRTLGEIFSLTASPGAFTAWCGLALVFAFRYGLRLQLVVGLALLLALAPMWIFYLSGFEWQNPFQQPEIVVGAGLLLGWRAIREKSPFAPTMRGVAVAAVLFSLFALSKWGDGSFLPLGRKAVEGVYALLCFAACGAGITLGIQRSWGETMVISSTCFAAFLLLKMYDWLWDSVPAFLFFALIGLLSLGLLYAFRRLRQSMQEAAA